MPPMPAARVDDNHLCPMMDGPKPHVGGPIQGPGCKTVSINGSNAARITDKAKCASPAPDIIVKGSPTVLIGNCGLSAARVLDTTAHGGSIVIGEPKVLIGDSATVFGPGPLTPEQAKALFDIMAAQGDLAFGYPIDGCYARAELMAERMEQLGLDPSKAWTFAAQGGSLMVTSPTFGAVYWGYHVATTVLVQSAAGPVPMVFDPSLFPEPVTMADWAGKQQGTAVSGITPRGQAPGGAGSGYWPADDPAEGVRNNAFATMKDYLKHDPSKAGC